MGALGRLDDCLLSFLLPLVLSSCCLSISYISSFTPFSRLFVVILFSEQFFDVCARRILMFLCKLWVSVHRRLESGEQFVGVDVQDPHVALSLLQCSLIPVLVLSLSFDLLPNRFTHLSFSLFLLRTSTRNLPHSAQFGLT